MNLRATNCPSNPEPCLLLHFSPESFHLLHSFLTTILQARLGWEYDWYEVWLGGFEPRSVQTDPHHTNLELAIHPKELLAVRLERLHCFYQNIASRSQINNIISRWPDEHLLAVADPTTLSLRYETFTDTGLSSVISQPCYLESFGLEIPGIEFKAFCLKTHRSAIYWFIPLVHQEQYCLVAAALQSLRYPHLLPPFSRCQALNLGPSERQADAELLKPWLSAEAPGQ